MSKELTMPFSEEPVHFESKGKRLFGIFHPASDGNNEFGIIFANSGMQNRVGPHRLYVTFARILSEKGYSVLRIDFPGIGESEGTVTETHFDAHNPDDTVSAIDYLKNIRKIRRIALFGLCAGARNVIKAGSFDQRVERVIMWSLPIIFIPPSFPAPAPKKDPRGWMSKKGAVLTIKEKFRKSMHIDAWKRYLSSGGSLIGIFITLRSIFWNLISNQEKWSNKRHHVFFTAFSSYIKSGRPALFLYGDKDEILIEEFKEKISEYSSNIKHSWVLKIIPNANHSFTSIDTTMKAISETMEWLSDWSGHRCNY